MIESIISLVFDHFDEALSIAFSIIAVASSIAAVTRTPADDEWIGKIYKVIDILALNIGYAKEKPKKTAGGRFVAD